MSTSSHGWVSHFRYCVHRVIAPGTFHALALVNCKQALACSPPISPHDNRRPLTMITRAEMGRLQWMLVLCDERIIVQLYANESSLPSAIGVNIAEYVLSIGCR